MSNSFTFNLIDLTNNKVIENLKESLKGKEVIAAVKVAHDNGFSEGYFISIVVPESNGSVRFVDIENLGDYDFNINISELYDGEVLDAWFTDNDKDIAEVEKFIAYDAVKYICRHWDEL